MTTTYYAVTSNNGLISQQLSSMNLRSAISELKDAITDGSAVNWHNDNQTDIEEAVGVNCDGLSFEKALELCSEHGAEFAWGSTSDDCWVIYSVTI